VNSGCLVREAQNRQWVPLLSNAVGNVYLRSYIELLFIVILNA